MIAGLMMQEAIATQARTLADIAPLAPELLVVLGAFALLMLDLFLDERRRIVTHACAIAVLLGAMVMVAMGTGGPASMVAFDHARTHNPAHRLSTATGITNVGGFLAALIAIFLIGLTLDLQGAGTPATYTLDAFRLAFLVQVPLWLLGGTFIVIERKRTCIHIGMDPPRTPRRVR